MSAPNLLDRLRHPQYTGENRCIPCTVVNVGIALGLAATVIIASVVLGVESGGAVLSGTAVFLLSAGLIYLRGYLVPGTPWFTKTYFPDWLLRRFDKHPSVTTTSYDESDFDESDIEEVLKELGAVTECENANDLCLTDEFRARWRERIATIRTEETSRSDLAEFLNVDADKLSIEDHGEAFVARLNGRRAGQWESHAAFLADMAATKELHDHVNGWATMDVQQQGRILQGLRLFLEQCPACDGLLTIDEDVVESCCRSTDIVAVTCQDCDARVFEVEHPG